MSNSKISALTFATTVAGSEVLPIVQSSATVKVSIANLTPGLGTITAAKGGTGQTSYAVGDLLYADTTTTLAKLADVATGNALISGGVGVAPSWGKIGLTTHVSGVLPVANGGTNASTASITSFNNITGYSASGATGTTTTNLVFSTSPTLVTPTLGAALATSIKFGSGTVLSTYEEGTWTPNLTGDGGGSGQTYTSQTGTYTKIGRVVTVNFYINLSAKGTITGNAIISNLPFTVLNTGSLIAGGALALWSNLAVNHNVIGMFCNTNSTNIYLWGSIVVASTPPYLTTTDIANNTRFWGSVTYMTA